MCTEEREVSYQELNNATSARNTLNTFNPRQPTHFVSTASPKGITASVYQERKDDS